MKLTSELSLRGKLKNQFSILISSKLEKLEKYESSFTSSTSFKHIHILTDATQLSKINLSEVGYVLYLMWKRYIKIIS